ncbi:uncharacterized protein A4U43_C10F9630 [Asparagus officinalis]|uniref:Uncharacterized protein n=1 Tax=Asparagus officinalis TaxID=4686 RepID=A0A5P1E206_ASPOF|nr:uncharacterized protein A4U43_C10F9630 [Asparagus officinalis]
MHNSARPTARGKKRSCEGGRGAGTGKSNELPAELQRGEEGGEERGEFSVVAGSQPAEYREEVRGFVSAGGVGEQEVLTELEFHLVIFLALLVNGCNQQNCVGDGYRE